ncbi:hypothetical protein H5410_060562 [Solanum commersonii]|uniref:Uncharacterized protein n=1 Tax=Solanum commersonii TaxID=4109 RepID=A0A9J5W6E2_SOLCO|nr:hypothetical protein H5410_060562 [Solanum commersonii]
MSPYGFDLSNLNLSKIPQLSLSPSITSLGEIMPLSSVSPVLPGPLTSLSLFLPGFKSSENLNQINRIEQVAEMTPVAVSTHVSASKPTPSNFMPQISIAQNDNSDLTSMGKQFLSPNILKVLQDMIQKEVKNYVLQLENKRDSMNTEATMDAIVNNMVLAKIE